MFDLFYSPRDPVVPGQIRRDVTFCDNPRKCYLLGQKEQFVPFERGAFGV